MGALFAHMEEFLIFPGTLLCFSIRLCHCGYFNVFCTLIWYTNYPHALMGNILLPWSVEAYQYDSVPYTIHYRESNITQVLRPLQFHSGRTENRHFIQLAVTRVFYFSYASSANRNCASNAFISEFLAWLFQVQQSDLSNNSQSNLIHWVFSVRVLKRLIYLSHINILYNSVLKKNYRKSWGYFG